MALDAQRRLDFLSVAEMMQQCGEDSLFVKMAATMFSSIESTLLRRGRLGRRHEHQEDRRAVPAGLTADFAAMLFAVCFVRLLFG